MKSSDQLAAVEPQGLIKLVKSIKDINLNFKNPPNESKVLGSEKKKKESLRK